MSDKHAEFLRDMADDLQGTQEFIELTDAADEIEQLRARADAFEKAHDELERMHNRVMRASNQHDEWRDKRIEELEAILRRLVERRAGDCFEFVVDDAKAVVGPLDSGRHIITADQTRAAWRKTEELRASLQNLEQPELERIICNAREELMKEWDIVRCEGCGGNGLSDEKMVVNGHSGPHYKCPDCAKFGSHGWVKKGDE